MTNTQYLRSLLELARGATPGEWSWYIHDHTTASLCGDRDPFQNHVLDISPCRSCQDGAKEWEWGRCTTPHQPDANYIAAMSPDRLIPALEEALQAMEARPRYPSEGVEL